eukprot:156700-Amphidinium_carterae.1
MLHETRLQGFSGNAEHSHESASALMVAAAGAASTSRSAFSAEGVGALRVPDHKLLADAAKDEEEMEEKNDDEEGDAGDGTRSKSKQESDGGKDKKGWFDRDAAVAQAISTHK